MTLPPSSLDTGRHPGVTRLERNRAAVLVVDVQEKLLPVIAGREGILARTVLLLRVAKVLGLPALLTTQYRKGLGGVVADVLAVVPDADPIDKVTFGALGCDGVRAWLDRQPGRDQLLLAGIETHICVTQTALEAIQRGITVHVISDAVGARSQREHEIGLRRMARAGAVLSSLEMATYEILERAATDEFRAILPLIV